jgi:hypothetical protein
MSYSSQIKTVFSGPSSSTTPPHNGLAVGSKYVVMVEGSRIEWTDLTGGSQTVESTYSFFSSLSPTGNLYHQRSIWDGRQQPYIIARRHSGCCNGHPSHQRRISVDGGTFGDRPSLRHFSSTRTHSERFPPTRARRGQVRSGVRAGSAQSSNHASLSEAVALFDQFAAEGFGKSHAGERQITPAAQVKNYCRSLLAPTRLPRWPFSRRGTLKQPS